MASADGLRFRVPVETLNADYSWKYFGEGKGITYFTFMSDQFTEFYGVVIPGAVREALYILDGLLEQQTVLKPVEIMKRYRRLHRHRLRPILVVGLPVQPALASYR